MRTPRWRCAVARTLTVTADGRVRTFEAGRVYVDVTPSEWSVLQRAGVIIIPPLNPDDPALKPHTGGRRKDAAKPASAEPEPN